ncbi:MAG: hypothetical protein LIO79_05095 [Rikenellaceae bacterium]|nr:hypothetical protein [Rikenellaceae bacterium]
MGVLLFSCTKEEPLIDWKYVHNQEDLMTDSKAFFLNLIIDADTRGILNLESSLTPGEITPLWENAFISSSDDYDFVFVPFDADYYYVVREQVTQKSGEIVYRSYVVRQILCIRQDKITGEMRAVYLTLTPTRAYHMKHRSNVTDNFLKNPNHGGYSGLVFYYDVVTMKLLTTSKYKDGIAEAHITAHNIGDKAEYFTILNSYVKNYTYFRKIYIATRQDGETDTSGNDSTETTPWDEDYDYDYNNENPFEDIDIPFDPIPNPSPAPNPTPNPNPGTGDSGNESKDNPLLSQTVKEIDIIDSDLAPYKLPKWEEAMGWMEKMMLAEALQNTLDTYGFNDFINAVNSKPSVEHGAGVNIYGNQITLYKLLEGSENQVTLSGEGELTHGYIHSHTSKHIYSPSMQDVITTGKSVQKHKNFKYSVIRNSDGSYFIIYIEDRISAINFYENYGIHWDGNSQSFASSPAAQKKWTHALESMSALKDNSERYLYALSGFLRDTDSGIVIYNFSGKNAFSELSAFIGGIYLIPVKYRKF